MSVRIVKLDGSRVEYSGDKIKNAIRRAMTEGEGVNEEVVDLIESEIREEVNNEFHVGEFTVEMISDMCEDKLLDKGFVKSGKRYIEYRLKHNEKRDKKQKFTMLSDEFLSKYKHLPEPFPTVMSHFTYLRTYSRFLPEEKRREKWFETVCRVVEYNTTLAPTSKQEAEELFDNIFNLRQFPSGRSLWVANTEVSKKYPMANYNCAFAIFDNFKVLSEGFYLLLVGAGMGFRVLPSDIEKLPQVRNNINIVHKYYDGVPKGFRKEYTELEFVDDTAVLTIADSKESWVRALEWFLELHYNPMYRDINHIQINYDNIRPAGEVLKTFGGYASGYQSMYKMFMKIEKVIKKSKGVNGNKTKLTPIDGVDMANIVGENVVSGGVRRTAEIILFDQNDKDMVNAKTNLYKLESGKWVVDNDIIHRQMSNNSIIYYSKPTREQLHWQIQTMRYSGEPAWVNAESANKRRPNFNGVNACSEILLDSKGMCNLTEIVPSMFIENGKLNEQKLYRAQALSARLGYRMTLVDFELNEWDYINKRDRLIACSITGWQDAVNELSLSESEQIRILNNLRDIAVNEGNKIADELGLNRPVLSTAIKPSGTISLLPAVSSGLHFSHSEFYIRRIRINANDPLATAMKEMGFNWKPEVGQSIDDATTIVFEFPMKSPKGKTKYDVSAIEQLEIYKMFMDNYVQHNASITVHVRENEWEAVEEWVWNNWDDIVAVSFLPLDDSFYDLLPYESISEEVYNDMISSLPEFKPSVLSKYEKGEEFEVIDDQCSTGACPVK